MAPKLDAYITITKSVPELTNDEYKKCYRLNFGEGGTMRDNLKLFRTLAKNRSKVTMVFQGDMLLGWSLIIKTQYINVTENEFAVYVRKSHRRLGIGRYLFGRARMGRTQEKSLEVDPHDVASIAFYKPYETDSRIMGADLY